MKLNVAGFIRDWEHIHSEYSIKADKIVEQEARKVLEAHLELTEFVMAMGTAFFKEGKEHVAY